ncbi:hypothetical protein L211DRAFT_870946 [Terfezia boudieri ATCC MYA-4762]|uniref:Uncharacterized protein n=1 Tax=Terfezia boudieri ATCC MYA-4762 TaxID=1051890 RepID=A0A3N4LES3_9PEZI|nr:hypothetical protein L211DRAFT_870946 [Terfezia boudieri ATCC MYA-4762]
MTTKESNNPLNPQPSTVNEVRTTMVDATLGGLERLMHFHVQGIQERQERLVRLYDGVINRDSLVLENVQKWLDYLSAREPQDYLLEMTFLQLLLDFEAKEKRISELTGEVLRLGDNLVQGSKDDHYFAQRLTGVFRKVEDWVYQTFKNVPDIQRLGHEVENSCSEVAGDRWRELLEKEHILLFTSAVTMELVKNVLEPRLLGINHDYLKLILPAIEESFVKNTNEDIKWRTKTIDILSNNHIFWEAFNSPAVALATKLFMKFSGCTEKKPAGRIKILTSLIKDTGSAATECQTQPSEFQFKWLPPGSRYKPKLASDVNNTLGDQALNDKRRRLVVVMTVAPAVLRVEYGSEKEVVVVKARVLLEEGSPLCDEGSQEESLDGRSSQDTGEEDGSSEEEDETSDEEGGISNEHDRGSQEDDGGSQEDDGGSQEDDGGSQEDDGGSQEDDGGRQEVDGGGEVDGSSGEKGNGGVTRDIDMNTENEEQGVSEEQGMMPEIARNCENNLETEGIEHERASESTGSNEGGVRREAGWSGEEPKEEENPERKRTEGEIDKQEVEEGGNSEYDSSHEVEGVKEVEDHEAGISHGGDKELVDTKFKKGSDAGDNGRSGFEGNKQTMDHEARKISSEGETSVGNRKFEDTTDERGNEGSEGEGGNRDTKIEQCEEGQEELAQHINVNAGNVKHGVSEEQGLMTEEIASNRESNRQTEEIEDERTSEATESYEESIRREAGWSREERREEESPERKRAEGEIVEQDVVKEGGGFENDGSYEMDETKEVADHEAGISGERSQVDSKVIGNKKGNVDDKGSCGEEGSTHTADREAEISPTPVSADGMTCHNASETRDNSEEEKNWEDQDSSGDLDKAKGTMDNAEGANFEDKAAVAEGSGGLAGGEGGVSGGGKRMMEEGGFEEKDQSCEEEARKSEEISKTEVTESCEDPEEDKRTEEE